MEKVAEGFMVLGVRHFANGEHHWLAPEGADAEAFGELGKVTELDGYYKPVFSNLKDAENYAMSLAHGECRLASWEMKRPTYHVVEADAYIALVEKDSYALPEDAEEWSDAKMADFERETDCEDIEALSLWDSDSDEEIPEVVGVLAARALDSIDGMSARVVTDGVIAVTDKEYTIDGIRDFVDNYFREGALGCANIEFSHSDGDTAYFAVKA